MDGEVEVALPRAGEATGEPPWVAVAGAPGRTFPRGIAFLGAARRSAQRRSDGGVTAARGHEVGGGEVSGVEESLFVGSLCDGSAKRGAHCGK